MRKLIIILFLIGLFVPCRAQDPQFSQYYSAPLYLNPGFTGTTPDYRVVFNNRIQWPELPQAFTTYSFSMDMYKPNIKSGFGLLATTDKAGSVALRNTSVGLLYSYKIITNSEWVFSPGLYFGFGGRSLDYDKIVFGDQIDFNRPGAPTLDPASQTYKNHTYFDIGSGLLIYNRTIWIGASFYHMNTPDYSLLNGDSPLPMKMSFHAGARIPLYNGPRKLDRISSLTPSFVYRIQGPFQQLDAGLNLHIQPVTVGLWYRGIPVKKNYIGNTSRDALVAILGFELYNFEFGYSYDMTISELSIDSGGSHEISLVYQFEVINNRKRTKRKDKFIPCPSFNSRSPRKH